MISSTSSRTSRSSSSEASIVSPSAYRCTSGSSGSGSTCDQPRASLSLMPSVRSRSRPGQPLVEHAHHETLLRPRTREPAVDQRRRRKLGDELGERPIERREQLEQLGEARNRVVGGQELREDVPPADGSREDDPVCGCGARQLAERIRRPDDLERVPGEIVDLARHRDRERGLALPPALREQPDVQQQRLVDGNLVALLVDEVQPLAGLVEDRAEIRSDRGHESLRVADRLRQRLAVGELVREEAVRRDRLDAERADHERQNERRRGVAVVDDDPEPTLADRRDVERFDQILRVALPHARRVRDRADTPGCDPPELLAGEVLLDLLLQARGEQDAARLVDADEHRLWIEMAGADMHGSGEALRLQHVPADGRRGHTQVGDIDPRGIQAGDHRPLDHAARREPSPGSRPPASRASTPSRAPSRDAPPSRGSGRRSRGR